MALTPEDLAALADVVDQRIDKKLGEHTEAQAAEQETAKAANAQEEYALKAGIPDVDPTAGPTYYVHLANGDVIETQDSGATHMTVDGETVAVIGRYQKDPKVVASEQEEGK
jgi:photosystem II stability/assembly factor-like uncharacterized protein